MFVGECRRCRPRRDTELAEDVLQVPRDGMFAEDQRGGDLPVALSGRHQTKYLLLPRAEAVPGVRRGRGRLDDGEVRAGAELRKGRAGRLKLQRRRVLVAQRTARPT